MACNSDKVIIRLDDEVVDIDTTVCISGFSGNAVSAYPRTFNFELQGHFDLRLMDSFYSNTLIDSIQSAMEEVLKENRQKILERAYEKEYLRMKDALDRGIVFKSTEYPYIVYKDTSAYYCKTWIGNDFNTGVDLQCLRFDGLSEDISGTFEEIQDIRKLI